MDNKTPWSVIDESVFATLLDTLKEYVAQEPNERSLSVDDRRIFVADRGIDTRWSAAPHDGAAREMMELPKSIGIMVLDDRPRNPIIRFLSAGADLPPVRVASMAVERDDFHEAIREAVLTYFARVGRAT